MHVAWCSKANFSSHMSSSNALRLPTCRFGAKSIPYITHSPSHVVLARASASSRASTAAQRDFSSDNKGKPENRLSSDDAAESNNAPPAAVYSSYADASSSPNAMAESLSSFAGGSSSSSSRGMGRGNGHQSRVPRDSVRAKNSSSGSNSSGSRRTLDGPGKSGMITSHGAGVVQQHDRQQQQHHHQRQNRTQGKHQQQQQQQSDHQNRGQQQPRQQRWQQQRQQQQQPVYGQQQQRQYRKPWQQQQQQQQRPRQQPVLLFQGSSSSSNSFKQGDATNLQGISGLLISRISSSQDVEQLQQVIRLHQSSLNPVTISAVISRLAKLCPEKLAPQQQQQGQPQQGPSQQQQQQGQPRQGQFQQQQGQLRHKLQQMVEPLLQQFVTCIDQATAVEISCIIGGLARLGYDDCYDVITACVDVTRDVITDSEVENKILLQLGWGLARIGHKPDDDWLLLFEQETFRRLPTFNNIETANSLWVFAKWAVKPSDAWLSTFLNHLPSQLLNLQPPEICSICWAAAMLHLQLPTTVLDSLLLEAQVKFAGFSGQGFGTLAWSLARMDLRPKRMWIQDFVRNSGLALPALSQHGKDQAFTNILWALACWEHLPPQQWLQDFCRCVVPQLQFMTPQGLTIIAVGLAELQHKPPSPFTCYLLELFHQKLTAAAAKEAASFIWALPRLLLPQTLSAAVAAAAAVDSGQQQQQQQQWDVGSGVGIAASGWLQQYCWLLQDLADHILPGLDKLSYTDLVDSISGFADVGFFPGVSWMDAHEVNLNRQLDQLTTVQINIVKQAYLRLEQVQQQQQRLLHPEQLRLLQQQQRAAAGRVAGDARWHSGRLAASAAAAASATAAESIGWSTAVLDSAAAAAGSPELQQQQQQQEAARLPGNSRLQPPAWATNSSSDSSSSRKRDKGSSSSKRGRGRGRGRPFSDARTPIDQEDQGLSIEFGREKPLQVPRKPRAARIRIQRMREAEREQRQQEQQEWRQRLQQMPKNERWRVAKPHEIADDM